MNCSGKLDCDLDMETGLLNFHDEEHFVFGDEVYLAAF